jgi:hypothetical protein
LIRAIVKGVELQINILTPIRSIGIHSVNRRYVLHIPRCIFTLEQQSRAETRRSGATRGVPQNQRIGDGVCCGVGNPNSTLAGAAIGDFEDAGGRSG